MPFSKPGLPISCVGPAVVIVSAMVVLCVRLPEVPMIVTFVVPATAVLEAVRVNVLVLLVLAGLNEAVTPVGRPLAVRATEPVKPPESVTVIVLVPLAPAAMLRLLGEADSE